MRSVINIRKIFEEQIAKANKALQELRKTLPELKITLEDINVADECHKYRISWRCLFLKVTDYCRSLSGRKTRGYSA